jgi:hypothetical protein
MENIIILREKFNTPQLGVTITYVINLLTWYRLSRRESGRIYQSEVPLIMIQSAVASRKPRKRGHGQVPTWRGCCAYKLCVCNLEARSVKTCT